MLLGGLFQAWRSVCRGGAAILLTGERVACFSGARACRWLRVVCVPDEKASIAQVNERLPARKTEPPLPINKWRKLAWRHTSMQCFAIEGLTRTDRECRGSGDAQRALCISTCDAIEATTSISRARHGYTTATSHCYVGVITTKKS